MPNKSIVLRLAVAVTGLILGSFAFSSETLAQSVDISADNTDIQRHSDTTLRWTSANATRCTASGGTGIWPGTRTTSGSFPTGALSDTVIYSITCFNSFGSASDSVQINVSGEYAQEPTVDITADNTNIVYNAATNIRWFSNNATNCNASGGTNSWTGPKLLSGFIGTGSLTNTVTYTITCSNNVGSESKSITINVGGSTDISEPVTVDIWADNTSLGYNSSTVIRWTSSRAANCRSSDGVNNWSSASRNASGLFYTGNLTDRTTYTITCYNSNNSSFRSDSVSVNVSGQRTSPAQVTEVRPLTTVTSQRQTVSASVPAKKASPKTEDKLASKSTGATASVLDSIIGKKFPTSIVGWLLLLVLVLLIIIEISHIIDKRNARKARGVNK